MMSVLKLEEYENDFWRDVNNRMSWDQIIPGDLRNTKPITLTQEVISQFAKLIGDDNPLYYDEEYATSTPYGGIVAPPNIHIVLMFACTDISDWMRSPGTINCGQNWYYNIPARPGDTITMRGSALDKFIKKERLFAVHENVFTNQHGQVICTGRGQTIRPV